MTSSYGAWNRCAAIYTLGERDKQCGKRTKHGNTYCPQHTEDFAEGVPFSEIGKRASRSICLDRNSQGQKCCVRCKKWKEESEFLSRASAPDGLNYACKSCTQLGVRASTYGVSSEFILNLLEEQNSLCCICEEPLDLEHGGKDVCIDHDHKCCPPTSRKSCGKCIRGILCRPCNFLIGIAREDSNILSRAQVYLDK